EGERRRALDLEDFFDEHAGHDMRRAAFVQLLRDNPREVGRFLATDQGPVAGRLVRTGLPLARPYMKRRFGFDEAREKEARAKLEAALDRIVAERQPSGFLVGDTFSVADLTAASLLYPLAWPPEFQYELPNPDEIGVVSAFADHPGVAWIKEMWREHRG